jgi:hypothetical protein
VTEERDNKRNGRKETGEEKEGRDRRGEKLDV